MANSKKKSTTSKKGSAPKKKKIKLTAPIIILIAIIVIVLVAVFGISYVNTSKSLKNTTCTTVECSALGNKAQAKVKVSKDCDEYDVSFRDLDGHDNFALEGSKLFNQDVSCEMTLSYDKEYNVVVYLKSAVLGILEIQEERAIGNFRTGINENKTETGVVYDDFQIHFLELGNEYAGDSTYIKVGDVDILIDAGSRGSSASTIVDYVKKYCTDGKLEYVIATHSHQDHIAGFAGTSKSGAKNYKDESVGKTGVLYYFDVGTIIDFAYAEATPTGQSKQTLDNKIQVSSNFGSSTEYGKYLAAREYAISKGASYYTAKECFNNTGDARSTYELAPGISMNILYNYYYSNTSNDVNNYSVCTMFTYNKDSNSHNFLLTGDLELEGETKLAEYYNGSTPEKTLPHVDLFKGGHHGSKTSSNEVLLSKITPDICCICCCAGYNEYTVNYDNIFPTQEFINRIAKYTELVYVTSMYDEVSKEFKSMNGNIIISCDGTSIGRQASNNLTILKDTEWFNGFVYLDSSGNCATNVNKDFYTEETAGAVKRVRRTWPTA